MLSIQKIRWKVVGTFGIALCICVLTILSRKDTNQTSTFTQNDATRDTTLDANHYANRDANHDALLDVPTPFTIQMRMNLNNTKHAWPWGEDKYNTQER